ncbi:MAG: phosphate acyltransferase PlsX [Planctomycetota bacterium]|jgi:glycerol-3-phosphate acyltransferase PlsX
MRIAVDAMGGDYAPLEVVRGAVAAVQEDSSLELILVGDEVAVKSSLDAVGGGGDRIEVEHAEGVIRADENPLQVLRRQGNTSIGCVASLLKRKKAEAMVSAGNTGATVAGAIFSLKLLDGVRRAGIATFMPTAHGRAIIIDVGANLRCRPEHLLQYAVMGSVYTRLILERPEPKIGLLNIGQEDAKGNDLVKETHRLFAAADINFLGNLEGNDVFMGQADVVVCEGFVGNVLLKVSEGLAEMVGLLLGKVFGQEVPLNEGEGKTIQKSLEWLRKRTDYREYGGAPLLGVNGACIIGHGRSDARAIANAIQAAARFTGLRVNQHIVDELHRVSSTKC